MNSLVVTLSCFLALVAVGSAANKCYDCLYIGGLPQTVADALGVSDKKCEEPSDYVNVASLPTCSTSDQCQKRYYEKNDVKLIHRTCLPKGFDCDTYVGLALPGYEFKTTCCKGNLCNTSTSVKVYLVTVVSVVVCALLL